MFTGLIESVGVISACEKRGGAALLYVTGSLPIPEVSIGDSVAVDGVCLTVASKSETSLAFDVSPESMASSTIGKLRGGHIVNLERALKLGDRMGGHIVTGHVDCVGRLVRISEMSGNRVLEFALPPQYSKYLTEKGSVAINGISLTVNLVSDGGFTVNVIPHTYSVTTLNSVKAGDSVNIETDIIGKYVERLLRPWEKSGDLTFDTLAEHGFI